MSRVRPGGQNRIEEDASKSKKRRKQKSPKKSPLKRTNTAPIKKHTTSPVDTEKDTQQLQQYKYHRFIVFVDDPKLKTPFSVLHHSNIRCLETKESVNNKYLNNNRRLRRFDLAFTTTFSFPCRVFAKCENFVTAVYLHKTVDNLNAQFGVLMACKVDVETAYLRLLEANPRKVKGGIHYETGEITGETQLLPDTASSFSEVEESQEMVDGNESIDESNKVRSPILIYLTYIFMLYIER